MAGFSVDRLIDLSDRETQERFSRAARVAFFKIIEAWRVRDEDARQLLGGVSNGVYYQLKSGQEKTLNQDRADANFPAGGHLQSFEHTL